MNLKRATVVLLSLLVAHLMAGTMSGCSFDFGTRYECQAPSTSTDAVDASNASVADACGDAGGHDAQDANENQSTAAQDAGGDDGASWVWIVPILLNNN